MTTFWIDDATLPAALLGTLLPFVAFVLIMVLTRAHPRLSAALAIGAITVSLGCAIFLLCRHWNLKEPLQYTLPWLASSDIQIPSGLSS